MMEYSEKGKNIDRKQGDKIKFELTVNAYCKQK